MTVTLTSPVEGKQPGDTYTGADEAWLVASGYARLTGADADTAPVLTGTSNAVNVVTGGNLVVRVGHEEHTIAIATADTPAQAATKIDTALSGEADAAIVSSKLQITGTATGYNSSVEVVSGTGTVLANLGVAAGASANGTDGQPGLANTGPADTSIANNREFTPVDHQIAESSDLPEGGTNDGVVLKTADAPYTSVQGGAFGDQESSAFTGFANDPDERPVEVESISPATGTHLGGTVVTVTGFGLDQVTSVTFDGAAGTSLTHDGRSKLTVTTPVGTAGPADLVFVTAGPDVTEAASFTYS